MRVATVKRVQISGAPYERGTQLGHQARERIACSVALYRETFAHLTGLSWGQVRERASSYRPAIEEYDEEMIPEMEGIAAGAGLELEDVLAMNTRTEIMYGISGRALPECTAFGARSSATAGGGVLVAQNWDWLLASADSVILLEVDPLDRPAFVTFVEAGLLAKMGFNETGIASAANLLLTDGDRGDVGVPFHCVLRAILTASTFEEALAAVTASKRASSANYVLASADGDLCDLEARPGGPESAHRIDPVRDIVRHANSFCGPIGSARDRGLETLPDAPRRTERMGELLDEHHGSLDVATVSALMQDHDGHPSSICRHEDATIHPLERLRTVGSTIMDLETSTLHLALGQPCTVDYEAVTPEFARNRKRAVAR